MQHLGKLIDATYATIALLYQLHKAVGKFLAMQTSIAKCIITLGSLFSSTQHREYL